MNQPIEVTSIECYSGHKWVFYFSDDTFARIDSMVLANCFPYREPIPASDLPQSGTTSQD